MPLAVSCVSGWMKTGYRVTSLPQPVVGQFHDPELVSWMRGIIESYQLPAAILHLEITESALIDVPEIAATVMHALHPVSNWRWMTSAPATLRCPTCTLPL
jgi:hypothetical protein